MLKGAARWLRYQSIAVRRRAPRRRRGDHGFGLEGLEPRLLLNAHPFLLTTFEDFDRLQALAEQSPWREMVAHARVLSSGVWPDERVAEPELGVMSRSEYYSDASDILSATSLLYIVDHDDPQQRQEHLTRIVEGITLHLPYLAIGDTLNPLNTGIAYGGSVLFNAVLAFDVIYEDPALSAEARAAVFSVLDEAVSAINVVGWWPYARFGAHGIWNIFLERIGSSDPRAGQDYLTEYHDAIVSELTPDGVFASSTAYALQRLGDQLKASKSLYMDVLEFTGRTTRDHRFYDDPQIQNFFAWAYAHAVQPNGSLALIGDGSVRSAERMLSSPAALRAGLFGPEVQGYAAYASTVPGTWEHHYDPSGLFTSYVLAGHPELVGLAVDPDEPDLFDVAPLLPTSRIFPDGGAWFYESRPDWQMEDFRYALTGTLWNPKAQDAHSQVQTNAVLMEAFGYEMLLNAGTAGWQTDYYRSWDYIHNTARSGNTLAFNYIAGPSVWQNHRYDPYHPNDNFRYIKHGGGIVEGFTADRFDYATGDDGGAVVDANGEPVTHLRSLVFIHPDAALGTEGYFLVFDEVDAADGVQPFFTFWHPNTRKGLSPGEVNIVTDVPLVQYTAPISGRSIDWYYEETFADLRADHFQPITGSWSAAKAIYTARVSDSATTISLLPTESMKLPGDVLPDLFQIDVSIKMLDTTEKQNGFVIFDYVDELNFKFAGVDRIAGKWVIGHYTNGKRFNDKTAQLFNAERYFVEVVINSATGEVKMFERPDVLYNDEKLGLHKLSFTFPAGDVLNDNPIGLGSIGADVNFDSVRVRRPAGQKPDLTVFYATPADNVSITPSVFASRLDGDLNGFETEMLAARYLTGANGDAHVVATLFPFNSTHALAPMSRVDGPGHTGAAVVHDDLRGVIDYALASTPGAAEQTVGDTGVTYTGAASVFRQVGDDTEFYFVRQGTAWCDGPTQGHGFQSHGAPVSLFMRGGAGNVVAAEATLVTFHHPDLKAVMIDGVLQPVVASGEGARTILVPVGTHEVTFTLGAADVATVTVTALVPGAAEPARERVPGVFRIYRDQPAGELNVYYSLGGTATPLLDYLSSNAGSTHADLGVITFADGQVYRDILILALPDHALELGNETVVLTLLGADAYQLAAVSDAVVTIGAAFPFSTPFIDTFGNGQAEHFQPRTGTWLLGADGYDASAGEQGAVSIVPLFGALPRTYQIDVDLQVRAGGGYIIFDHVADGSSRSFKFAGADVANGRWVVGRYDAGEWIVEAELPASLALDTIYTLRLVVEDDAVRLLRRRPAGAPPLELMFHHFRQGASIHSYRIVAGALSGDIGVGAEQGRAIFRRLAITANDAPLTVTLPHHVDFVADESFFFNAVSGSWLVADGTYRVVPAVGAYGLSLLQLSDALPDRFEIASSLRVLPGGAARNAFIIFDYKSPNEFKFAGAWVGINQWIIGQMALNTAHVLARGNYATFSQTLVENKDYPFSVHIEGSRATLWIENGATATPELSVDFGDALNAGGIGLGSANAWAAFAHFTVSTLYDEGNHGGREDFTDGIAQAMTVVAGQWRASDGQYHTHPGNAVGQPQLSLFNEMWMGDDRLVDVEMTMNNVQQGLAHLGFIVFDYVDAANFKFAGGIFSPDANGAYHWIIGQYDGGVWRLDAAFAAPLTQMVFAQSYHLSLRAEYETVRLLVDGVEKVAFTYDAGVTGGKVGLGAYDAFVSFDNFATLTTLDPVIHNLPPVISALVDTPDPVLRGQTLTLSANATDADGFITRVRFYYDSNADGVLDEDVDAFLGEDTDGSDGWTWSLDTADLSPGPHLHFARAQDNAGAWSATVKARTVVYDLPYAEDFDDAAADYFNVIDGTWLVNGAFRYTVTAGLTELPLSVLNLELPISTGGYRVEATLIGVGGAASVNAMIVFDYQSPTDFKFAGLFFGARELRIGQVSDGRWIVENSTVANLLMGAEHNVGLVLREGHVRLLLNGSPRLSHDFGGDLSDGKVGFGTRLSNAAFDNLAIHALPGLPYSQSFDDTDAADFTVTAGHWAVNTANRYAGTAASISSNAVSLVKLTAPLPPTLALGVTVRDRKVTGLNRNAMIVFAYIDPANFKYAGAFFGASEWRLGHVSDGTWFTDATFSQALAANQNYPFRLELNGGIASLLVGGAVRASFDFAEPLHGGRLGLATRGGSAAFDDFTVEHLHIVPELPFSEDFNDGQTQRLTVILGSWLVTNNHYLSNVPSTSVNTIARVNLNDPLPDTLAISAIIRDRNIAGLNRNAFVIFDYVDADNFKYAGAFFGAGEWRIGQVLDGAWFTEAAFKQALAAKTDFQLRVEITGGVVSLLGNGLLKTTFDFAAPLNDGQLGLGTRGASSVFDDLLIEQLV